jgi:hypothetical protein
MVEGQLPFKRSTTFRLMAIAGDSNVAHGGEPYLASIASARRPIGPARNVDRLVHVSERDAVPLRQAGWQELEPHMLANASERARRCHDEISHRPPQPDAFLATLRAVSVVALLAATFYNVAVTP